MPDNNHSPLSDLFNRVVLFKAAIIVKTSSWLLKKLFKTGGETWPGELVLKIFPFLPSLLRTYFDDIIFVIGTNGKTSTSKLLQEVLKQSGRHVITNPSGANLLNGLVSNILKEKNVLKSQRYIGVFEVDEYSFKPVARAFPPTVVIILNLLRDQLDRYGEVENIMRRWQEVFEKHPQTLIIAQAADPGVFALVDTVGEGRVVRFFGVPNNFITTARTVFGDYIHCPKCDSEFSYNGRYVSHIGDWHCKQCGFAPRVDYLFPARLIERFAHLPDYLIINAQGVYLAAKELGLNEKVFFEVLERFKPAFGRGETVTSKNSMFHLYLGKNPASWTVALEDSMSKHKTIPVYFFGLNNRTPDGHDVSWIWDIYFKNPAFFTGKKIYVFGDRSYDMAVRLTVADIALTHVFTSETEVRQFVRREDKLHAVILTNYSAMLAVRSWITGRSIG